MLNIWVATDWHLYNEELRDPRHPYRTIDNIDRLADNYGSMIQETDMFIFLGDLCDPKVSNLKKIKDVLGTIPCHKIMVKGNHDTETNSFYLELGFDEVCDVCVNGKLVFSHGPMRINPDQINVHGHLHMRKDSRLNSQYINAYDPEHRDRPYLLDDLLDFAAKQQTSRTEEPVNVMPIDKYETVEGNFTASNVLDITDRMSLLNAPINESVAELTQVSQLKTPKELSTWMKRNIHYANMTTIKSTAQMIKSKSGSCHDQVAFAFPYLREMGVHPRILFFIATNPESNKGGTTHSLIYWENESSGKVTWFENAWGGQEGIHEFASMDAMKEKIKELHSKTPNAKNYPELVFKNTNIKHFKEGYNLKQLVDSIMSNKLLENASPFNEDIDYRINTDEEDDGECDIFTPEVYVTGDEEFRDKIKTVIDNDLPIIMRYASCDLKVINVDIVRDITHDLEYNYLYYSDYTAVNIVLYYPPGIDTQRYDIRDALKYAIAGVIIHRASYKYRDDQHPMLYTALATYIFDDYNPYIDWHNQCTELDRYLRIVTELEYKYGHCIIGNLINGEVNFQDLLMQLALDESASDPLDEILFQSVADTEYFEQDDDYKPGSKKKDTMVEQEPLEEAAIDLDEFYSRLKAALSQDNKTELLQEVAYKNDKGEEVPKTCPECGADVKVYFKGEPVFLCSNEKCKKYFGTVPFNESVASTIDKSFKPKEKISLSSLRKVHITEELINKYKKDYPVLKHVRCKDTKEYTCDGYMWFDKNDLVCYVGSCEYTDDHTKWIVSLEIINKYQGHGLSKQILDFAVNTMGSRYLSVNKSNKLAKKIYDDYGFKTYHEDKSMYYMTLATINEMAYENVADVMINKCKTLAAKYTTDELPLNVKLSTSGPNQVVISMADVDCTNSELGAITAYMETMRKIEKDLKSDAEIENNTHIHSVYTTAEDDVAVVINVENGDAIDESFGALAYHKRALEEDTAQLHGISREDKTELTAKYGLRNVGQTHDANEDDPEDPIDKKHREQEAKKQEAEKKRQEKAKQRKKARRVKKRKEFVRKVKSKLPFKKDAKNEDSTDFDWMKMIDDNPLWGERLQIFDSPTQFRNETGYKFQPHDKLWFNEPITESAAGGNEKLYPVYIMLVHSGTALATAIKVVTHSHFSHSSISFDSTMHNMYSFGRKRGVNPVVGAFVKEDIRDKFFTDRTIPYALYVVPSTKSEVALMKKRLDYFIKNATKFDYDFTGLFKNYFGIADNPEYKWFCSRFVADIVNAGRPSSEPYVVEPSLMKPEDFQTTNFAIYVCGGYLNSYDSDFVDRVTKRILRAEQMRRAQVKKANAIAEAVIYDIDPYDPYQKNVLEYQLSTMNESAVDAFIQYLKSFKVRFDKDGNVIITRREMDQLDEHFKQAVKNVKAYQNAGNVVGVKDELCKVYYMIELINHYYLNPKAQQNKQIKADLRKEMLDLRSVMLNMFQQNLKYVTIREPQFNFQEYYDRSKYGKNTEIPKSLLTAIGKTIVTSLK